MHNADFFIVIAKQALIHVLVLSAPPVLIALVVGLFISILQATTQIQEQTLTFVPKLVAMALMLAIVGPQMLQDMVQFAHDLLTRFPIALH